MRAGGGLTTEDLQKKAAKDAENKSGSGLDAAAEKREARRSREVLAKVVFIKSGDKVRQQNVEVGIADTTHIEVKSGVKSGDVVVAGSYAAISRQLKDGMAVTIAKPAKEGEKR